MDEQIEVYVVMCKFSDIGWAPYNKSGSNGATLDKADAIRIANNALLEFDKDEVEIKSYKGIFDDYVDIW